MMPVITLDGPSGVGKGTIAAMLAERYGFHLLDSGAIYRVLAYDAQKTLFVSKAIDSLSDTDLLQYSSDLVNLAESLNLTFDTSSVPVAVRLDGNDISDAIRTEEIGYLASKIAAIPSVRAALLQRQRAFAQAPGLVADGRDMGTVVFPDALCKFFLTASASARAQRRVNQLREKGINASMPATLAAIEARDERDASRKASPLVADAAAEQIDTTDFSIEDVFAKVLSVTQQIVGKPRENC